MAKKIIIAVPQTSLKLFEVEYTENMDTSKNPTNEELLKWFKERDGRATDHFLNTVGVGEYRDRATIFAEVPKDI